ncbi:hypothetical protein KSP39_PZI005996 [Platanthera zijinensis]|uniref:Uncharacterized protein n=1 Tax=Platanthera zijinensis TaxID=2320716 RepID=A0AAP0BTS7_9ASPA
MSDHQPVESFAPSSSEDSLWEALEQSRRETTQQFQTINRTLAAIAQRLETQSSATPAPPINPAPASETPQVYPPAYPPVYPPLYIPTFPQGLATPLRSQNDEFAARQNFFREAARGSPTRFLNFQRSYPYSSAPAFAPSAATFPFCPPAPCAAATYAPFFPYAVGEQEEQSPFTDNVRHETTPVNFREPRLPIYTGETDPVKHLQAFESAVALKTLSDATKCKLFVTTFDGQVMDWFYELRPVHLFLC